MSLLAVFGVDDPNYKGSLESELPVSKSSVKCSICGTECSNYFKKNERGEFVCVSCDDFSFPIKKGTDEDQLSDEGCRERSNSLSSSPIQDNENNLLASKAKCKKLYHKRTRYDADYPLAKPVLSKPLKHNGVYFQIGDVVSLTDGEMDYYAQIRGLFRDQYSQGYAVITWLLPTIKSPKGKFDPDLYVFGKEEDIPRKLEEMTFVCNAPNESYMSRNSTYPPFPALRAELGFRFKHTGPEIVRLLPDEEYYNPFDKSVTPIDITSRKILSSLPGQKKGKKDTKKKC